MINDDLQELKFISELPVFSDELSNCATNLLGSTHSLFLQCVSISFCKLASWEGLILVSVASKLMLRSRCIEVFWNLHVVGVSVYRNSHTFQQLPEMLAATTLLDWHQAFYSRIIFRK